jgi:hypothetical protein
MTEKKERIKHDAYFTPERLASRLVSLLPIDSRHHVLEPHVGGGAFGKAIKATGAKLTGSDIQKESEGLAICDEKIVCNFLHHAYPQQYDFVVGNPPFADALDHVQKALNVVKPTGGVGFLLRIGFFASISRFEFWKNNPAKKVWVLAERPSFAHGTTDAQEYAFFYWTPGYKGITEIEVIRWKE